ncbi:MAG: hypothetical protein ACO1N0_20175 [Fluviicola sp.]
MRILAIYISLVFTMYSCRKNDANECTTTYKPHETVTIDPSLQSYKFKQGSYWIYQNDVTAQIDSQYVMFAYNNDFSGEYPSKCSGGTFVHEYQISVMSSFTNKRFDYDIIGATLYKDTIATGNHGGKYIFNNLNSSYPQSGYEQIEIIPSMNLNGNTLQNIKKIYLPHLSPTSALPSPYNLSDHDLYLYFKESVGLVKWEVVDGSTVLESWSIQSWEVFL